MGLPLGFFKEAKQVAFGSGVLIAVLALYVGFWVYGGVLADSVDGLRAERERLGGGFNQEAEKSARLFAARLSQVGGLLDSHIHSSDVLKLIEEVTYPRVQFTQFTFQSKDGLVSMSGLTDGYINFGQQIIALEANASIHNLHVSNISLNKKGQVAFSITFKVDKSVYQKYGP